MPVYGKVPHFELTASTGEPFDSRALEGKVWVADFIFTTCTGPCPRMSTMMRQVQSGTAALPEVQLVSFTVDPVNDTPPALAEYAKHYNAQPGRWHFLTGPETALNALALNTFKLGTVDGSMVHSTRFIVIDRKGRIRAYYGTDQEDPVALVLRDVKRLLSEKS